MAIFSFYFTLVKLHADMQKLNKIIYLKDSTVALSFEKVIDVKLMCSKQFISLSYQRVKESQ